MIAITFALPTESCAFQKQLSRPTDQAEHGTKVISGLLGQSEVEIVHTGVGEKSCRRRVEPYLQERRPRCLISSGFAGATGNDLAVGQLVLAENFSDPRLLSVAERILQDLTVQKIKLFTSSAIVDSTMERNAIGQQHMSQAVDMETAVIAQFCAAHGVPMLSMRVITDTPEEPLPAPPRVLFNMERQKPDLVSLTTHIISHPAALPRLIGFHQRITRARTVLAEALTRVLRSEKL